MLVMAGSYGTPVHSLRMQPGSNLSSSKVHELGQVETLRPEPGLKSYAPKF